MELGSCDSKGSELSAIPILHLNLYCIFSDTYAVLEASYCSRDTIKLITRYDPKQMYMCCSRAMTSILCACAVHVLFMRYNVIVGIPLLAMWGGGNILLWPAISSQNNKLQLLLCILLSGDVAIDPDPRKDQHFRCLSFNAQSIHSKIKLPDGTLTSKLKSSRSSIRRKS